MTEPMLIALHGQKGSGKNTITAELKKQLGHARVFSFGTVLKQVSSLVFRVPLDSFYDESLKEILADSQNGSPRDLMTSMADALKAKFGNHIFANHLAPAWNEAVFAGDHLIVTDLRHHEEAQAVHALEGTIVPIYTGDRPLQYAKSYHISEKPLWVSDVLSGVHIDNSGPKDQIPAAVARFLTTLQI